MYEMERTASSCGSTLAMANYEEQEPGSTRTEMTVVRRRAYEVSKIKKC
jgi:hypothetical protein